MREKTREHTKNAYDEEYRKLIEDRNFLELQRVKIGLIVCLA